MALKENKFMCALGNCETQCFTCSEDEKCDIKWGGKREGAGRKKKEDTETTGFRINSEALNICRVAYGRTLNKQVNDFIKRLAKKAGKGSG